VLHLFYVVGFLGWVKLPRYFHSSQSSRCTTCYCH